MRSQRIRMTVEEYHLLPFKPGWKCEYYDGMAHIQPRERVAILKTSVQPRPVDTVYPLRGVTPEDKAALIAAFYESFQDTSEYCDWTDQAIRTSSVRNLETFFARQRGAVHPASRVAETPDTATARSEIIGAALVVRNSDGPCLDLLFVRPKGQRQRVATALVSEVMNILHAAGEPTLWSGYYLANEPSIAWHYRFGFEEEPDLNLAECRATCAQHELWRREQIGDLSEEERATLEKECAYWKAQVEHLHERAVREGYEAVTPILRRRR